MSLQNIITNLSENALIANLTSKNLIVYDDNKLQVYNGFVRYENLVQYANKIDLILSVEPISRGGFSSIIVSSNGNFVALHGKKSIYIIRINSELLSSAVSSYNSQYYCECFPLHENVLIQKSTYNVIQVRISSEAYKGSVVAAVLFSDNCIRFFDLNSLRDSYSLSVDFRFTLFDDTVNATNNTFGLQKEIVSFDLHSFTANSLNVVAVDSDGEFHISHINSLCFTAGESPRLECVGNVDPCLPSDPISIQFIETEHPEIASVLALLSFGNVISHIIAVPDEFGMLTLTLFDQLSLPTHVKSARIVDQFNTPTINNRYEISTANSLLYVDISSWADSVLSIEPQFSNSGETVVCELLNTINIEKNTRKSSLQAFALELSNPDELESFGRCTEFMYFVITHNEDNYQDFHFAVLSLRTKKSSIDVTGTRTLENSSFNKMKSHDAIKEIVSNMKPLPAFMLGSDATISQAIDFALSYFEQVLQKLQTHTSAANDAIERLVDIQLSTEKISEKQQNIDERMIEESKHVDDLKIKMYEIRDRSNELRKKINIISSRIEENLPLTNAEIRIYERLKKHQSTLSQLSIMIPQVALEAEEQKRLCNAFVMNRSRLSHDKFANVEINDTDIENLAERMDKLKNNISVL